MILKAYRYRLYPNAVEQNKLAQHFGCTRLVFNLYLEANQKTYEETGKGIKPYAFIVSLPKLKKTQEYSFLKDVNSQSLQSSVLNAGKALDNFFANRAGYPRFKNKRSGRQSFQCPQNVRVHFDPESLTSTKGVIELPKIGRIKAKLHRRFVGDVATVTIIKEPSGKYYASVLVDDGVEPPKADIVSEDRTAGCDAGIKTALVVSYPDGTVKKFDNHRRLIKGLKRLKIEQKILARKKVSYVEQTNCEGKTFQQRLPSKGYSKQREKLSKLHEYIRHCRLNDVHQISHTLANDNQVTSYVIEDLNIKGMVKNHKLARAILDVGIGHLYRCLEYKLQTNGKNLIRADRFYPSSKRCCFCGHRHQGLTLKDRQWQCEVCGQKHDRDECAARNLAKWPFLAKDDKSCAGRNGPEWVKSSSQAILFSGSACAKGLNHTDSVRSHEASEFIQR